MNFEKEKDGVFYYRRNYYYKIRSNGIHTYVFNRGKIFHTEKNARKYLIEAHEKRIAKISAQLPPISQPKIISIDEIPYPAYCQVIPVGIRVQKYKGLFFDEAGNYIDTWNFENDNKCRYWGVIYHRYRYYNASQTLRSIGDFENFLTDQFRINIYEYINYNQTYHLEKFRTTGITYYRIDNQKDVLKISSSAGHGIYIYRYGGYYEMGYRGHISESSYYLYLPITTTVHPTKNTDI